MLPSYQKSSVEKNAGRAWHLPPSIGLDMMVAMCQGITPYVQSRMMLPAELQDGRWADWRVEGVGSDPISLSPSNLGPHKPFSGPLHKTDSANLGGMGILPTPHLASPSPGLQGDPIHWVQPHPRPSPHLDRHMANMETEARLGWSTSGCCWFGVVLQVSQGGQASPTVARLRPCF